MCGTIAENVNLLDPLSCQVSSTQCNLLCQRDGLVWRRRLAGIFSKVDLVGAEDLVRPWVVGAAASPRNRGTAVIALATPEGFVVNILG